MPTKKTTNNLNITSIMCQETKQKIDLNHLQLFITDLDDLSYLHNLQNTRLQNKPTMSTLNNLKIRSPSNQQDKKEK